MSILMEVNNLNKKIGDLNLSDINLKIEPGYIVGLLGVNGSGKTSLIKTILNLYKKDTGVININGFSMETNEKAAKNEIGFVLDEDVFEETMSVLTNAKIFGSLYDNFNENLFKEFCKNFNIPLNKKLGKLSTGLKVRFQLAFSLAHDAKLFIMDEPTAGLDPLFRKELINYMQQIVEDGSRSVLFSTHITEDLDQVGNYIILINNGKVYLDLSKEELKDKYKILQGGKSEIEKLDKNKIIYREYGEYYSFAFVEEEKDEVYEGLKKKTPTLEEIMYCLDKGGYAKCLK